MMTRKFVIFPLAVTVNPGSTTVAVAFCMELTVVVPPTVTVEAVCAKDFEAPPNSITATATTPTNQFFKLVANTDLFIIDRLNSDEEE